MLEEAYKKLIADLEEATRLVASQRRGYALMAVVGFLGSTGCDGRLLYPLMAILIELMDAQQRSAHGGAAKPVLDVLPLVHACAAVTVIVERGGKLDTTLTQVSETIGLDKNKLRNYRKNLLRRRASGGALGLYNDVLTGMRANAAGVKAPR